MQAALLLIPFIYLVAISIPLSITDIREHRLPNRLTLSAALVTLTCLSAATWLSTDWLALLSALVAATVTFLIGWFLAAKSAIGMGDIKLLISLNAFAGYLSPLLPILSLTIALVAATLVSSIFLLRKRFSLQSSIALGPYLLLGFFVAATPGTLEVTAAALS